MWSDIFGCKIQQSGSSPNYTYRVAVAWADHPVNYVSWGDAARFANWRRNGEPTGAQELTTTEDGSYFLDGAMSNAELMAITREADATWVIPSEDEWVKAAYHKNDGVTGNYWDSARRRSLLVPDSHVRPRPRRAPSSSRRQPSRDCPFTRLSIALISREAPRFLRESHPRHGSCQSS